MQNKKLHGKKKILPSAIKIFISISSLAGTIGIWNLLSNKDAQTLNISDEVLDPTKVASTDIPQPIPTIASLVVVDTQTIQTSQSKEVFVPTPTLREVTRPQEPALIVENSNPVILGANPVEQSSASNSVPPAPVTTTRSSRP